MKDDLDEQEQLRQKRRQAAIDSLNSIVSKYSPATPDEADTFFTTTDIVQSIAQHTGVTLDAAEIYELMTQMSYTADTKNNLEMFWLLKKDEA